MAFEPITQKVPTRVQRLTVVLESVYYFDQGTQQWTETKDSHYVVEIVDQDGQPMQARGLIGTLTPHLTQAQITALVGFMNDMRTKAETEFLPAP